MSTVNGYTVHADFALARELTADDLFDDLQLPKMLHELSPSFSLGDRTLGVTASIEAHDPIHAAELVNVRLSLELRGYEPTLIAVDVETWEATDAALEQPNFPQLLGAAEVGELLDVSRQRVHQLHTQRDDFPPAIVQLRMGPLWLKTAIEAWAATWERKPGRPVRVMPETVHGVARIGDVGGRIVTSKSKGSTRLVDPTTKAAASGRAKSGGKKA